ncbi:DNA-methyltransferase [Nocardia blacklockiae]|uniref:DNA-methyltransferase n=1 Tax=Nocardia blacklockiae TaxID=480036 RepID=UPI001893635F|nr:site-specific DNA-methyltransferase [Nocardia blacklockiae]MBF6171286.1 site-specific DNA-methyltransferase [Nocardia blacklockiae]
MTKHSHLRFIQGGQLERNQILVGDALDRLRQLPEGSIDQVLTSPPYFRLRNYGTDDQIGLETHVDQWVERLAAISAEVHRLLVPTGTYWLNLGDTYSFHHSQGALRKSLLMAPERLALRLQRDGWIIRNKVIWAKTNPIPISVRDRLACTYEVIYVLAKQPTYFFDLDAIRQPHKTRSPKPYRMKRAREESWRGPNGDTATGLDSLKAAGLAGHPLGKNPGDVWQLATANHRGDHHAMFPMTLATRAIQAGCPEARCTRCRQPWRRRIIRALGGVASRAALGPTCDCRAPSEPGIVADPFIGSGTTAVAAEALAREWLGVELNPAFAVLANDRIADERYKRQRETEDNSPGAPAA